jgi:Major intrinsic protein
MDRNDNHRPFARAEKERVEHHKRKALKNHLIAASGEFVGTILFLWFAFAGTQVAAMVSPNLILDAQRLLYIALSFGMSLLVVAWAFFRISGGLFNPAVSPRSQHMSRRETMLLTVLTGHAGSERIRSSPVDALLVPAACSAPRRHRRCSLGVVHVSRAYGCLPDEAVGRHLDCAR